MHRLKKHLLEPVYTRHFSGVVDYLQTEVSTSKEKKFPLVTFVDTPGLVDGDMNYPFDVNEAILWLGDLVDMIFVFFDPIGQVCATHDDALVPLKCHNANLTHLCDTTIFNGK